ncbi:MAG TPA: hypothetical protein VK843_17955 [Planctomycetota bacterium]|nr:hypothetical protein [Planctomycetota bacterium]
MSLNLLRLPRSALALALAAGLAHAGSIRIAERPQLGTFTNMQTALNAALEGESLLVTPGVYSPFTIDGKSVQVLVLGTGLVQITGQVVVKNLGPAQCVVLSQIRVQGNLTTISGAALEIRDVTGNVRVEGCIFEGAKFNQALTFSGSGALVDSAVNVVFSHCRFEGGYPGYLGGLSPVEGAPGLNSIDSSVGLYDCDLEGGYGSDESAPRGGNGGPAFSGRGFGLFASGCTFEGGRGGGGDFTGCYPGGVGGDALLMDSAQAHLLDNTYVPGLGGWYLCGPNSGPGQTIVALNGSIIDLLPGSACTISATNITTDDALVAITITGQPGDTVYFMLGRRPSFVFKKLLKGCWMIPTPMFSSALPVGTIGANGQLVIERKLDIVDGSAGARVNWVQAMCVNGAGQATLTGGEQVLSIDQANALAWYVDASAPPGGTGSQAAPFQTISDAVNRCFYGDMVHVAAGLYQGPGNRMINLNGRSLTLRSASGSSNCTIDCQGLNRAFTMILAERLTVEGFTIAGADQTSGAAVQAVGGQLTLRDMVIGGCVSFSSGAVYMSLGELRMENCRFLGNVSTSSLYGRGAALHIDRSRASVSDCVFASNSALEGGAVYVAASTVDTPQVRFTHCSFLENQATIGGACCVFPASSGTTHVFDDCLFAGNTASTDGGALMSQTSLSITSSTFVSNSAAGRGGAMYLLRETTSRLDNSIAYANTANQGPAIFLGDGALPDALLGVSYSDVQGGPAAVWLSQGILTWGAGNIDLDPLFTDADGADNNASTYGDNDYSLSATSACVDAGDNGALTADLLDVDGDGNTSEPVPLDLLHGARRVDVVNTPDTGAGTAPIVDMGALERPF